MSGDPSLTWVGHATALLDDGDVRVLTDPVLTRRVAHLRRRRDTPDRDVAEVDLVLLSHAHMDHLHLPSLRRLRPGATAIAPAGAAGLLRRTGFHHVRAVTAGDVVEHGSVTVEVVPAAHQTGRGPHSGVEAEPVGYVVTIGGRRVYFAGDTDLFDGMADLVDIDLALLPIWGWGPTLGRGLHLDPARAVEAADRIDARRVVPIHWGTYAPEDGRRRLPGWFDRPIGELADAATGAGLSDRICVLEPGRSTDVTPR